MTAPLGSSTRPATRALPDAAPAGQAAPASAPPAEGGAEETGGLADKLAAGADVLGAVADKFEKKAEAALDVVKETAQEGVQAAKRGLTGKSPKTKAGIKARAKVKNAEKAADAMVAGSKEAKALKGTKALGKALDVVGTVATAVDQYEKSTAQTKTGKLVDAAAAGAVDYAFGKANPLVAGVDAVVGAVLPDKVNVSIGNNLQTSVRSITTVGEGLVTGESKGMETFHERSKAGDYGPIFQAASEAGEFWEKQGVGGGMKAAWDSVFS